jgi:ElaB/YqjD/DUF883 family membrane-anchored ribosome-binding protein
MFLLLHHRLLLQNKNIKYKSLGGFLNMSDIAKLIEESIDSVMVEADVEKSDPGFELTKKVAKIGVKEHLSAAGAKASKAVKDTAEDIKDKVVGAGKKAVSATEDMDIKGHLVSAGNKTVEAVKDKAEEVKDLVKEHPYLSAATAAGLAAGVGGLAAVKKMRKAAKKK